MSSLDFDGFLIWISMDFCMFVLDFDGLFVWISMDFGMYVLDLDGFVAWTWKTNILKAFEIQTKNKRNQRKQIEVDGTHVSFARGL